MTSSVRGKKYLWQLPEVNQDVISTIALKYNLSFPIAQTLYSRGFHDKASIDSFLFSSLERDVPHPGLMKDAEKSVDRLLYALAHKQPILVFGDYDVDGITSSALMMICLLPLQAKINFYLPHRVRDGYGISTKIVERAAQNGYKVIVTVDNGITAFEPAKKARELGIDLIITDHHRPHEEVPDAYAIVNPNQHDCSYPFKSLAGVGVTFKLLSLLYERKGLTMPSKAYELLLMGTIADVVPLLEENRYWVRYGLHYINTTESKSFSVLKNNGKVSSPRISATDIGFSITPQLNALGRLEDPRQGVKFLIGTNEQEVQEVGRVLLELNEVRKEIERSIVQEVVAKVESQEIDLSRDQVIIASSSNWPPGVIGLVASRIVSAYARPTILFHRTKDGILKGSCRSIPAFNMFNALQKAGHLLIQFGGHSVAAGLSLKEENLPALKEHLNTLIQTELTEFDLLPKISIDAQASLADFTKKFMQDLAHLEPFGNANSEPVFQVNNVVLVQKPKLLKDLHVKCSVFSDGVIKPLIFFNRPEIFDQLNNIGNDSFSLAVRVYENHWNGRSSVEMTGHDIALEGDS